MLDDLEVLDRLVNRVTLKLDEMLALSNRNNLIEQRVTDFTEWAVSKDDYAIQNIQDLLHSVVIGTHGRRRLLVSMANYFKVSK